MSRMEVQGHREVHMIFEPIQHQGGIKSLLRKGPSIETISLIGLNGYIELIRLMLPLKKKKGKIMPLNMQE